MGMLIIRFTPNSNQTDVGRDGKLRVIANRWLSIAHEFDIISDKIFFSCSFLCCYQMKPILYWKMSIDMTINFFLLKCGPFCHISAWFAYLLHKNPFFLPVITITKKYMRTDAILLLGIEKNMTQNVFIGLFCRK